MVIFLVPLMWAKCKHVTSLQVDSNHAASPTKNTTQKILASYKLVKVGPGFSSPELFITLLSTHP